MCDDVCRLWNTWNEGKCRAVCGSTDGVVVVRDAAYSFPTDLVSTFL